MKRNFTLGLAVSALMALITAVVNAQDVDNPWHLVAFENDEEVAFYNTEMITGIEATTQNVTISLDNGKEFTHPTETATFGFEPRKDGTGTANEAITTPGWSVSYTNNRLHFSKPVTGISVYTIYGTLVTQFTGIFTEIPVNLSQGIYIVKADGKSAKVFVGNNSNGSAVAQPIVQSKPVANSSNPVNLRAGNIKIYWNITASNSTMSVEIPNVEKFYFTAENSIVFTLKNGNTIELTDYKGVEFTIEPTKPSINSKWNMDLTMKFGGAAYGVNGVSPFEQMFTRQYISVFTATEIICYDVTNKVERKYQIKFIPDYESRITMVNHPINGLLPVYSHKYFFVEANVYVIEFNSIEDGSSVMTTTASNFGGSNLIETTFSIENGNLKTVFNGGEYVFK